MYQDILRRGRCLDLHLYSEWLSLCHDEYNYIVRTTYNNCNIQSSDLNEIKQRIQILQPGEDVYIKPKIVRIYQPYQVNNHEWYVPFIMHMDRVMAGEKTHYGYKEIKTKKGLVTDEIVYFNASVWENPLLEIV